MSAASEALKEFHDAFDIDSDEQTGRCLGEEMVELAEARFDADGNPLPRESLDLEKVAREMADVAWTAYGDCLALGIDLDVALALIYRANMAKMPDCKACDGRGKRRSETSDGPWPCSTCGGTGKGKPVVREDGKILRPEGWRPPNMAEAIVR